MAGVSLPAADALKKALFRLFRSSNPTIAYQGFYSAKVVVQSEDRRTVDLQPDDPRLPAMSKVPIRYGMPGVTAVIPAGNTMIIGWDNADPQRAYATLFNNGDGAITISISVDSKIELGGQDLRPLLDQLVVGRTPCQYTGAPHHVAGNLAERVFAK